MKTNANLKPKNLLFFLKSCFTKYMIKLLILSVVLCSLIFSLFSCGAKEQPYDYVSAYPPVVPPGAEPRPVFSESVFQYISENRLSALNLSYNDLNLSDWISLNSSPEDLAQAADLNSYFYSLTGLQWDFNHNSLVIPLDHDNVVARTKESIIANFITDALLWKGRQYVPELKVFFCNGGSFTGRGGTDKLFLGQDITAVEIGNIIRWSDESAIAVSTLKNLVSIFERAYHNLPNTGLFYHQSGLIIEIDIQQSPGDRIQKMSFWNNDNETKELFFDKPNFVNGYSGTDTIYIMANDWVINIQLGLDGNQYETDYDNGLAQTEAVSVGEYLTYLAQNDKPLYTALGYNDEHPFRFIMSNLPGAEAKPYFLSGYAPVDKKIFVGSNYESYMDIKVANVQVSSEYNFPLFNVTSDSPDFFRFVVFEEIITDTIATLKILPSQNAITEDDVREFEYNISFNDGENILERFLNITFVLDTDIISIEHYNIGKYKISTNDTYYILNYDYENSDFMHSYFIDISSNGKNEGLLQFNDSLYIYNGNGLLLEYTVPDSFYFSDIYSRLFFGNNSDFYSILNSTDNENKLFKCEILPDRTIKYYYVFAGYGEYLKFDNSLSNYLFMLFNDNIEGNSSKLKIIRLSDMKIVQVKNLTGDVDSDSFLIYDNNTNLLTVKTNWTTYNYFYSFE